MCSGCIGLASLPEKFFIPDSVQNMDNMFSECRNLTSFSASFDFPLDVAEASSKVFYCASQTETYFAGGLGSASNVLKYSQWESQNRTLVTDVPAGKVLVEFDLPNESTGGYDLWTRQLMSVGAALPELAAPLRAGSSFLGWYTDKACTAKFNFATDVVPAEGLVLYAKYLANSGMLPTTDGGQNASWSFEDGTLSIRCDAPGAVIADLQWTSDKASAAYFMYGHWGHVRDRVVKVVMEQGVQARSMAHWFDSMGSLTDVEGVYVPQGVTSLRGMFAACFQLKSLPDDFSVPDGVTDMGNCFVSCSSLEKLPGDFTVPDSVTDMSGCFARSSIGVLPASFQLPKSLEKGQNLFMSSKLASLPTDFALPDLIEDASHMFYGTPLASLPTGFRIPTGFEGSVYEGAFERTNLTDLPAGFTIPSNVGHAESLFRSTRLTALPDGFEVENPKTYVMNMFQNCPALSSIPASLKLVELKDAGTSLANMFGWTPSLPGYASEPVTTYYAGSPDDVLGAGFWKTDYNRELVSSAVLPAGAYTVSFSLQKPDAAAPETWMTQVVSPADGATEAFAKKPSEPSLFGYSFSGWCDQAGNAFDFSLPVTQDVTLYGTYVLIVDIDMPLATKVVVDASGKVEPAPFDVVSRTPVAMEVGRVNGELASGASRLFANEADLRKVGMSVAADGSSFPVPLDGTERRLLFEIVPATASRPSVLEGSIGLSLNGAQIDYQPGDDITSFAKLTWTVGVAP